MTDADYTNGGVTIWCQDGHDPKLLQGEGTIQTCPECGFVYRVSVDIEPLGPEVAGNDA